MITHVTLHFFCATIAVGGTTSYGEARMHGNHYWRGGQSSVTKDVCVPNTLLTVFHNLDQLDYYVLV